jgi:hypothetical protein
MQLHDYKRLLGRPRENLSPYNHICTYRSINLHLIVYVTLPAQQASPFPFILEVSGKEENVKNRQSQIS